MPATLAKNITWSKFTCDMRDGAVLHFLPHEKNDYVPHVLKHHVLASYSAIAIMLKVLVFLAPTVFPAAAVYSGAVTAPNIIKLTNVAREGSGLSDLHDESRLATAAAQKADDIIKNQYFAHVSPSGVTPWDWIRGAGYDYRYAGENLAVHFFTAEGAHEGWMASPTHRQNILDKRYQDIGVGVQQGKYEGFDTVVVVQMFGTLKTAVAAAAPVAAPVPAPAPVAAVAQDTGTHTAPEPAPKPVVAAAVSKKLPEVVESSVKVTPSPEGYKVAAEVKDAVSVQAYLGSDTVALEKNEAGTWEGSLTSSSQNRDTQYLFVGASAANGEKTYQPVAAVTLAAPTADMFAEGGKASRPVKFLGLFVVRDLSDGVQRFYLYAIMLLLAALALKISVKFRIQRHAVIMHTMFVVLLCGTLYFIR